MKNKERAKYKICKYCQTEIPVKAKVCPNCRKKLKGGLLKWIILFLAVVLLFSMCGTDDTHDSGSKKVGTVGATDAAVMEQSKDIDPVQTAFYVGDILMDGDMKIVYMASGEYQEDNSYSQPEDGYKYIYLQFAFENTSQTDDDYITYYDFEGYADGYAVEKYYGAEDDLSATLSAGRATTGCVYFCVPETAQEIEIEYTPNMFLEEKITFVYEGDKDSGYIPVTNTTATAGAYHVDDIVEAEELRIAYLSCREYTDDYMQPKEGFCFISCEFAFENLSNSDKYISSGDFDCYADGISCDIKYIRDDELGATLSAGRKTKGTVTFEVPMEAEIIEVEYLADFWSSQRAVFAVE